jgi:hypothetical protein
MGEHAPLTALGSAAWRHLESARNEIIGGFKGVTAAQSLLPRVPLKRGLK